MQEVVFHLNEMEKWSVVTSNIRNLLKASQSYKIVLLINGDAIKGILEAEHAELLQNPDIEVHACRNSLRSHEIPEEILLAEVIVVPSGVVDLIELQAANYAYIKP